MVCMAVASHLKKVIDEDEFIIFGKKNRGYFLIRIMISAN
jgi:hypothetical protein